MSPSPLVSSRGRRHAIFAVLVIAVTAYTVLQTCIAPIVPLLAGEFVTTLDTSSWVVTANLLAAAILAPVVGRLGDVFGKRTVLVASLGVTAVGCAVAALAWSIDVVIAARVIQGTGAGVVPLAFGVIRDQFPAAAVAGAVGRLSALLGVGSGLGYVITGPVVDRVGYSWLFWGPCVVLAASALLCARVLPASPTRSPTRVGWPCVVLFAGMLLALLLGITRGSRLGWSSGAVIGLLLVAVLLGCMWAYVEWRSRFPLVDLRSMRDPVVSSTTVAALLVGFALYAMLGFVPLFVQTSATLGYGFSSTVGESGFVLLPLSMLFLVAGIASGCLEKCLSLGWTLVVGCVLGAAALLMLSAIPSSYRQTAAVMAVAGIGFGLAFASMSGIVVRAVPQHRTAVASAVNTNVRMVGGALGVAVTTSVLSAHSRGDAPPTETGYAVAFGVLAAAVLVAAAVAVRIARTTASPRSSRPVCGDRDDHLVPPTERGHQLVERPSS